MCAYEPGSAAEPRRRWYSAAGAFWKALNSPFVLFLLSSVMITGITP